MARLTSGLSSSRVGQNHKYTVYKRVFGRKFAKCMIMYGVHIRFWPSLLSSEDQEGFYVLCLASSVVRWVPWKLFHTVN